MALRVNYEEIAPTFDNRYKLGVYDGVLAALRALVAEKRPQYMLEAGCGTGYWLSVLRELVSRSYGLDYSLGMLRKANERELRGRVARATAELLPFRDASFDLIFCVNAIHHFARPDRFIAEARRLLRPGGVLAVFGMDPHHGRNYWCIYDYFPETRAIDLARYPSSGQIIDAMLRAGFDRVECRVACRLTRTSVGGEVLQDPELQRRGCSQMALLTDQQYAAGIERIHSTLRLAEHGEPPAFRADVAMMMQCGQVEG